MQFEFDAQELGRLLLLERGDRYAGPARDHFFYVIPVHDGEVFGYEIVRFAKSREPVQFFLFFFLEDLGPLEVPLSGSALVSHGVTAQLALAVKYLGREIRLAQLNSRSCLVDDINRLVGQESIRNVPLRPV